MTRLYISSKVVRKIAEKQEIYEKSMEKAPFGLSILKIKDNHTTKEAFIFDKHNKNHITLFILPSYYFLVLPTTHLTTTYYYNIIYNTNIIKNKVFFSIGSNQVVGGSKVPFPLTYYFKLLLTLYNQNEIDFDLNYGIRPIKTTDSLGQGFGGVPLDKGHLEKINQVWIEIRGLFDNVI